jgi:hypothetical protein
MNKDELLSGGYCFTIRNDGPFIIGKNFEAPGPSARILPRIKVDDQTLDELWALIGRQDIESSENETSEKEIYDQVVRKVEFENGTNEALSWYVSDFQFQAEIPKIRSQLKRLRGAVQRFESEVPDESTALGHFLFGTYSGEIMLQPKPSAREHEALLVSWRNRVGVLAIKDVLKTVGRNTEAAQMLIGKSKPRQHRASAFAKALAEVWQKATGEWPTSGRHPSTGAQTGPFADFVRKTNKILPKPFRIPKLDRAIRAACEARVGD